MLLPWILLSSKARRVDVGNHCWRTVCTFVLACCLRSLDSGGLRTHVALRLPIMQILRTAVHEVQRVLMGDIGRHQLDCHSELSWGVDALDGILGPRTAKKFRTELLMG